MKTARIAEHIIWEHSDEMPVTRTKLLKLLYLCDVEFVVRNGYSMTGKQWVKYSYGPYSDEILEMVLDSENIVQYSVETPNGTAYKYDVKVKPDAAPEREGEVIEQVVSEFELVDTTDIVRDILDSELVNGTKKYGVISIDSLDSNPYM